MQKLVVTLLAVAISASLFSQTIDDVKKYADYVTLSNDEEGIYECLKILSEKGEI